MQNIELAGQFNMFCWPLYVFLLAFPYILYNFWLFIKPGMYSNETKYAKLLFLHLLSYLFGIFFGGYLLAQFQLIFCKLSLVSKLSTILISFHSLN